MIELVHSLRRVCNHLDDVRGIALVGFDGLVVEELRHDPTTDVGSLGAELSVTFKDLGSAVQDAGLGALEMFQLATSQGVALATAAGERHFLLLILPAGANSGRARFYLQLEADRLAPEL